MKLLNMPAEITIDRGRVNNNAILGYKNTEEVSRKFNEIFDAYMLVGGVKIFEGKFKISEISKDSYKGNLAVPKKQTMKDLFGDKMMNEAAEWKIDFKDFAESVSDYNKMEGIYNKEKYGDIAPCFFPYVLYGVIPREQIEDGSTGLGEIGLGLNDLPPSINCLESVKKLFETIDKNITGSAFSDGRLSNLYMSYKNPEEYGMPWNYGVNGRINMHGNWTNLPDWEYKLQETEYARVPNSGGVNNPGTIEEDRAKYHCNLLNSRNIEIFALEDKGANVNYSKKQKELFDYTGKKQTVDVHNYKVLVPYSGFYKVTLNAVLDLKTKPDSNGYQVSLFERKQAHLSQARRTASVESTRSRDHGRLDNCRYEIKLIRNRNTDNIDIENIKLDGVYYKNNQQIESNKYEEENKETSLGAIFPNIPRTEEGGTAQTLFVDPAQNNNLVCGLSWGTLFEQNAYGHPFDNSATPLEQKYARILAAKPGYSWSYSHKKDPLTRLVIDSSGYKKYETVIDNDIEKNKFEPLGQYTIEAKKDSSQHYIPKVWIRRGRYAPLGGFVEHDYYGAGEVNVIVWLDKGEELALVSSSDLKMVATGKTMSRTSWVIHHYQFCLNIEPMTTDSSWYNVNPHTCNTPEEGIDLAYAMGNPGEFAKEGLNLSKFLPSNIKINDWLDNFCKAFNLELVENEDGSFELNTKDNITERTGLIIDLDEKADIDIDRVNIDLGFPSAYKLGFKIDSNEKGYIESKRKVKNQDIYEDGGGIYHTTSIGDKTIEQKSDFSYNWFKAMDINGESRALPIISDKEAWDEGINYYERMEKRYTDKAQRFWYRKEGETFRMRTNVKIAGIHREITGTRRDIYTDAALVQNHIDEKDSTRPMTLDYENKPHSILDSYFTVFVDGNSNYTELEAYLTPEEYANLDISLAKFNGDLYYIAEVDGYDPLGQKKAKIKLIKKEI